MSLYPPDPTAPPFIVPTSFYFETGTLTLDDFRSATPDYFDQLQFVDIPRTRLTQVILLSDVSPEQSATFFRNLKNLRPQASLIPNIILTTPTIKPSEATNPTHIPTGGSSGSSALIEEELKATAFNLNIDPFEDDIKKLANGRPVRSVNVVLVDTLPSVDITRQSYSKSNPHLRALIKDLQRDKLRFRPTTNPTTKPTKPGEVNWPNGQPQTGLRSSHGLFSANLIRQLAPAARVTIVEGLDKTGVGDMAWFVTVLNQQLYRLITEFENEDPNGAIIINLSLVCNWTSEAEKEFDFSTEQLKSEFNKIFGALLPQKFDSSKAVNIRILAAAGNDNMPHAALPAALAEIIEVVALDQDGLIAPYSNKFDPDDAPKPGAELNSGKNLAGTAGLQAFGGPVSSVYIDNTSDPANDPGKNANKFGYAQWSGTSFATAIASGVVALLCSKGLTITEALEFIADNPGVLKKNK